MNEHEQPRPTRDGDDADLAALLRAVGSRAEPPAEVAAAVRAVVADEWRDVVASRRPARRPVLQRWMALAASVAAVAIAVGITMPRWSGMEQPVAKVVRVTGPVEVRRSDASDWQPLAAGATVAPTDEIRTGVAGRVALQRPDGLELRLDEATQLALTDAERASLTFGSVYVDAGTTGARASDPFVVGTPLGDVRHLGTQYVTALQQDTLHVAVREGSVAVENGHAPVVARAGEALAIDSRGDVTRTSVAVYGDTWSWAESIAPGYAIEGRSVDEFLAWAARETGRKVVYTSADAAREAESTTLQGSVVGLAPEAAVAAVLASEPALRYRITGEQIRVERADR